MPCFGLWSFSRDSFCIGGRGCVCRGDALMDGDHLRIGIPLQACCLDGGWFVPCDATVRRSQGGRRFWSKAPWKGRGGEPKLIFRITKGQREERPFVLYINIFFLPPPAHPCCCRHSRRISFTLSFLYSIYIFISHSVYFPSSSNTPLLKLTHHISFS